MPTYDDRKKSINYYGVFALWSSILLLASYFSLYTSGCGEVAPNEIQISLAVAFSIGILLFLLSFCNIASKLYHSKFIFYLIVVVLSTLSALILYISYQTFGHKCPIGSRYYERNYHQFNKNNTTISRDELEKILATFHQTRNNHYLVSTILDLLSALLFAGSAYAFRNRF